MKIAFAHFRVGETDGVSLEMDKWISVLEKMGHSCCYIAGSVGTSKIQTFIIDEMHYKSRFNKKIVDNCYRKMVDFDSYEELSNIIFRTADTVSEKLEKIIIDNNIDIVVPNNIWSLGWNLPVGVAFTIVAKKMQSIRFIAHNHDFFWERELYSSPTHEFVQKILDDFFVPVLPNVKCCVINSIAYNEVKKRRGIDSIIVPNVFDFDMPLWQIDDYNKDFLEAIGASENDIVVLHATRIGERKTIEFGIDVVAEMQNLASAYFGKKTYKGLVFSETCKIKYVLCGMEESLDGKYWEALQCKMKERGVDYSYINNRIAHTRSLEGDRKNYSLWDAYVFCDIVTYTSVLEGWGNQLLEAVFAKKPVILFEYPVYEKSIKSFNLSVISVGNKYSKDFPLNKLPELTAKNAAKESMRLLFDLSEYRRLTEQNFAIGKKSLSYNALEMILKKVFC